MRVTVDLDRPAWMHLRGRRKASLVMVILALMVLIPSVALGFDRFSDVSDNPSDPTGQFHDQINAIAGAGITTGCNSAGTLFCPEDLVDRRTMAAFMSRGFSRVANNTDLYGVAGLPTVPVTGQSSFDKVNVGSVSIDVPGATGETQFVMLTGKLAVFSSSAESTYCTSPTCVWRIEIWDGSAVIDDAAWWPEGSATGATMSLNTVVAEPSGTTQTYTMRIWYEGGIATGSFRPWDFSLSAITAPFGATGGNTLGTTSNGGEGGSPLTQD
jgi:hypothetical protein